jgi:hypothetical protein
MPAKPSFSRDLPQALAELRQDPSDWVDRRRLELLLGISRSTAWRLLRQAGGQPGPGNTLVCRREELVSYFEQILNGGGSVDYEVKRRQRLESYLASIRPQVVASRTQVAPAGTGLAMVNSRFASLPPNVTLTPRSLHLDFSTPEEFLAAIGALVFALQNDYEKIAAFIAGTPVEGA